MIQYTDVPLWKKGLAGPAFKKVKKLSLYTLYQYFSPSLINLVVNHTSSYSQDQQTVPEKVCHANLV